MPPTLALNIGNKSAFSVRRLLENISWMLAGNFDLHLVTAYQDAIPVDTSDFELVFQGSKRKWLHPYRSEYASLDRYLDQYSPDAVVQLTEPPRLGSITGIAARNHDVTFVYRYSGDRFITYRHQRSLAAKIKSFLIGNVVGRLPLYLADYHVVLGPTGRCRLTERGVSSSTIRELPATIDVSKFAPSPNTEPPVADTIPSDRSIVLSVGRMTHMKGIDTFEACIPKVLDQRDDVHFLFVGSGSPPDVPAAYEDHVSSVGTVDPESMPGYYHLADLLVHPSRMEGTPRVIMEAMAAGTPVLARHVGDVPSITKNTFSDDAEFVSMLLEFEAIPVEDVSPFSRDNLKERYIRAFDTICRTE